MQTYGVVLNVKVTYNVSFWCPRLMDNYNDGFLMATLHWTVKNILFTVHLFNNDYTSITLHKYVKLCLCLHLDIKYYYTKINGFKIVIVVFRF